VDTTDVRKTSGTESYDNGADDRQEREGQWISIQQRYWQGAGKNLSPPHFQRVIGGNTVLGPRGITVPAVPDDLTASQAVHSLLDAFSPWAVYFAWQGPFA
jgi:hypothetical protein